MGQAAIGSCMGTLSVSLLSRDCGDFRDSPVWIPRVFDSFFILAPLVASSQFSTPFLLLYCGTIAAIWLLTATVLPQIDKTHFGIKFALPVMIAGAGTTLAWWYGFALKISSAHILLIPFAIVVATSLSDFGISFTSFLIEYFDSLPSQQYLFLRSIIAVASIVTLGYMLSQILDDWIYMSGAVVVIFLSIFDQTQPTSILSAAVVIAGILLTVDYPIWISLVLGTLYNNFVLHGHSNSSDYQVLPGNAVLDNDPACSKTLMNLCLLAGTCFWILSDNMSPSSWFLIPSFITAIWILLAPRIFPNRVF